MPARTTGLRCRWSNRSRSCGHQLSVDVGQYPRKILDAPDALRAARSEDLRKWVDPGRPDSDVVHRHARVVRFFDGVRRIGPRVAALVTLVGDQAVADHDEKTPL